MAVADNLLTLGQNYFSPDIVQKFSNQLGLSQDKTKSALKSIIPAFLSGVVDKGSTPEGAASLVNIVNTHDYKPTTQVDASSVTEDSGVVNDIFGSNLNSVVNNVNSSTGVDSSSIKKIMGMVAPGIMGFIASKVKNENLGSAGLMNFLRSQKSALASFGALSTGAAGVKSFAENKTAAFQSHAHTGLNQGMHQLGVKKVSWKTIALAGLVLLGLLFWWLGSRQKAVAPTVSRVETAPMATSATTATVLTTSDLGDFLARGSAAELPKSFRFQTLNFANASAALQSGAEAELDQIVSALKTYPAATARIEGFTDNVGSAETNKQLSEMRALAVKNELVSRGIAPERISAVGMGAANPVADNATAEGRALNRRIDFVVTKIK